MARAVKDLKARVEVGEITELHSFLVYHHGQVEAEQYFSGNSDWIDFEGGIKRIEGPEVEWDQSRLHYVASVTKTITALLTGIALKELSLTAEVELIDLLPSEYRGQLKSDAQDLTLHNLLTMEAGFRWDEWTDTDLVTLWQSDDFVETLLARPNSNLPRKWRYNSAVPNLILTCLAGKLNEPLEAWADRVFFQKLGIMNYVWDHQPLGVPEGSARLKLTPRDMLTIGQMILASGKFNEVQVVPKSWVEKMTIRHVDVDGSGYGYLTWLREIDGLYYISAEGDGGQYINIFPEHDLVVVMTAGHYGNWPYYRDQAEDVMRRHVLAPLQISK